MNSKKLPCLITACLLACLPGAALSAGEAAMADSVARLVLDNPSEFERPDENVRVSLTRLGLGHADVINLAVMDGETRLPSQLIDFDADGQADALQFIADFMPAQSRDLLILNTGDPSPAPRQRAQAEISVKNGGHWEERKYVGGNFGNVQSVTLPPQCTDHSEYIRYEGPGIESDLVGYRFYLDWRNGFDIFGKKVSDMVLQDVGQDGYDSYHEPADWGMDVLKVGDAAGMGGYGFWDGEKLNRVADVQQRSVKILDNGPVYAQLEILYEGWKAGETRTDLSARLAMQAGSRLVNTRLQLSEELDNVAVGIVKHPGTTLLQGSVDISGHAWTWVASWGKQSLADDHLGMMVLFRRGHRSDQLEDEHNYVSVLEPRANGQVEYYFGAIWEQEPNGVATEDAFRALVEKEAEKLTLPLRQRLMTAKTKGEIASGEPLYWSRRLAASEMARRGDSLAFEGYDDISDRPAKWTYTAGLLAKALDDAALAVGGEELAGWARDTIDSYITDEGEIRTYKLSDFNIDKINSGKMLLRLYERTGEEKYLLAAGQLRAQLKDHPRTSEGAFWHKKIYPGQLWLDGVYMGMPFLAHYSQITGDPHGVEEAVQEFVLARKHLRDPETGLYYHGWDEKKAQSWADPETGLSAHFWSRGMGWYAMALVDVLDFIPEDRADLRQPLLDIIPELADALLKYRHDAGWYQVTDRPDAVGNFPEASGSSMFVYLLAKAINKGYLGPEYRDVTAEAWNGLVREFINVAADGSVSLEQVCAVAGLGFGRDGSYHYYMSEPVLANDPKGVGPFIMAGLQVAEMHGN